MAALFLAMNLFTLSMLSSGYVPLTASSNDTLYGFVSRLMPANRNPVGVYFVKTPSTSVKFYLAKGGRVFTPIFGNLEAHSTSVRIIFTILSIYGLRTEGLTNDFVSFKSNS